MHACTARMNLTHADMKHWKPEIGPADLMNGVHNHFRQIAQRINTIIIIHGNRIVCIPGIIPSHLSNPHLFSACLNLIPFSVVVWTPLSLTPFFSPLFKSNISFKRDSFSGKHPRQGHASCLPLPRSRYCLTVTRQGCSHKPSQKQSPQIGSQQRTAGCASGGNPVQSSIR